MAQSDAFFEFDTNIEEVRARIHAGLDRIAQDTSRQRGSDPAPAQALAGSVSSAVGGAGASIQDLGRQLEQAIGSGAAPNQRLVQGARAAYENAAQTILTNATDAVVNGMSPDEASRLGRKGLADLDDIVTGFFRGQAERLREVGSAANRPVARDFIGQGLPVTEKRRDALDRSLDLELLGAERNLLMVRQAQARTAREAAAAAKAQEAAEQSAQAQRKAAPPKPARPSTDRQAEEERRRAEREAERDRFRGAEGRALAEALPAFGEASGEQRAARADQARRLGMDDAANRIATERRAAEREFEKDADLEDRMARLHAQALDEDKKFNDTRASLARADLAERARENKEREGQVREREGYETWWSRAAASQDVAGRKSEARDEMRQEQRTASQRESYERWWEQSVGRRDISERAAEAKAIADEQEAELRAKTKEEVEAEKNRERTRKRIQGAFDSDTIRERIAEQRDAARPRGINAALGGFLGAGNATRGADFSGLAASAGLVAKYSLLGASLYALQAAFRDTATEAMDYVDSLTMLENAVGNSTAVNNTYINSLSEVSRFSGANVGAAIDAATRGVNAFGVDPTTGLELPDEAQLEVGREMADVASQMALIVNTDLKDATGNVIAIGTAFGQSAENLGQVNDAIAHARRLGGDPKQIAQGLASFGNVAQEAGFDLMEAADILSLVQARTDQSGAAVATRLTRIFSMFGGAASRRAREALNIDTSGSIKQQIEAVAEAYGGLSQAQQASLRNALGGTANLRELMPLLTENATLQQQYARALEDTGSGQEAFEKKSADLVGLLRRIQGDITNLQIGLFQSNIFAPIGIILEILEPTLHALDRMLQVYNQLPSALKTVIALTLEFVLAQRLLGKVATSEFGRRSIEAGGFIGRTLARTPGARREGLSAPPRDPGDPRSPSRWDRVNRGTLSTMGAWMAREGRALGDVARRQESAGRLFSDSTRTFASAIRSGEFRRAFGVDALGAARARAGQRFGPGFDRARQRTGDFLNSEVGALGLALGGAALAQATYRTTDEAIKQLNAGIDALGATSSGSADEIEESARALATQAQQIRESTGGIIGSIVGNILGSDATADLLDTTAQRRQQTANRLREMDRNAAEAAPNYEIDISSAKAVDESFKELDKSGRSARGSFESLLVALDRLGVGANEAENRLSEAQTLETAVRTGGAFRDILAEQAQYSRDVGKGRLKLNPLDWGDDLMKGMQGQPLDDIQNQLERQTRDFLTSNNGRLTPEETQKLVEINQEAVRSRWKNWADLSAEDQKRVLDSVEQATRLSIGQALRDAAGGFSPGESREALVLEGPDRARAEAEIVGQEVRLGRRGPLDRFGRMSPDEATATRARENILAARKKAEAAAAEQGETLSQSEIDTFETALREIDVELADIADDLAKARGEYAMAMIPQEDLVGRAQEAVNEALRELGRAKGQADKLRALGALKERRRDVERQIVAAESATARANRDPRDRGGALADDLKRINDEMAITTQFDSSGRETQAFADLRRQKTETLQSIAQFEVDQVIAIRDSAVDPLSTTSRLAADLQAVRDRMGVTLARDATGRITPEMSALITQEKSLLAEQARNSRQQNAARARAGIDPRSSVDNAQQDVRDAQAEVDALQEGQDGYWEAQRRLREAQVALAEAQRGYAANMRLLSIDMTNPVEMARAATQAALDKLRDDLNSGASADVIAADQVAVKQAQQAEIQTEFDFQMSLMRRRKDLGQITHAAYMDYLRSEEQRLIAAQDGSWQLQDQLMTVQAALKAAAEESNGMFNLGDIRVPTPYEVRRAMAERNAGYGGPASFGSSAAPVMNSVVSNEVQVNINGGDTTQLMAVLERYLGPAAAGQYAVGASRRGF